MNYAQGQLSPGDDPLHRNGSPASAAANGPRADFLELTTYDGKRVYFK